MPAWPRLAARGMRRRAELQPLERRAAGRRPAALSHSASGPEMCCVISACCRCRVCSRWLSTYCLPSNSTSWCVTEATSGTRMKSSPQLMPPAASGAADGRHVDGELAAAQGVQQRPASSPAPRRWPGRCGRPRRPGRAGSRGSPAGSARGPARARPPLAKPFATCAHSGCVSARRAASLRSRSSQPVSASSSTGCSGRAGGVRAGSSPCRPAA